MTKITPQLLYGFSGGVLSMRYDNPKPTPKFHVDLWRLVCGLDKWVAIAAPRGHAKTTCVTHAYILANVLFRAKKNVLIVSDTEAQAKSFLANIKTELMENDLIRQDFQIDGFDKDNELEIEVRFKDGAGFKISARGSGQKLRGLAWKGIRPDLIVCDDMENDELVLNEERREKLMNWFLGALMHSGGDNCQVRVIGTILSMDSLLEHLLHNKKWKTARFAAHNEDFSEILWPEKFSKEELIEMREMLIEEGKLDVYSREMLNRPITLDNAFFRPTDFRPLDRGYEGALNYYITTDSASSTSVRANYSAFVVSATDEYNRIRVVQVVRERLDNLEFVDTLFALYSHYRPSIVTIEGGPIGRSLETLINAEMMARNIYMNVDYMQPIGDKKLRAAPIQARMRQGNVQFDTDASWFAAFQQELLEFDKGRYDDQVDALAWLGQLLDKLNAAPTRDELFEEEYQDFLAENRGFEELEGFDYVGGY